MRRSFWRSRRGACADIRNIRPGGPGSPSSPTTRGRLQWQDATGRKRAKSRRINGTRVLVRPPRMVPGPKIAAVERREARHPTRGMSHEVQTGFASLFALSDKVWCAARRSAPSDCPGKERTTGAAASANNAGDAACVFSLSHRERVANTQTSLRSLRKLDCGVSRVRGYGLT